MSSKRNIRVKTVNIDGVHIETISLIENSIPEKVEPYKLLIEILSSNEQIKEILKGELKLVIDDKTLLSIQHILNYLVTETGASNILPIKNIINEMLNIFVDSKLDISDVPSLVVIMTEILNIQKNDINIVVDYNLLSVVTKFIIYILIDVEIIKTDETDFNNIAKIIDTSMKLLQITLKITDVNTKCNLSCFPLCNK